MKSLSRSSERIEIQKRLIRVRHESPARWGRMSAHQMICHLADTFRMATGERAVRPTGNWLTTTALKWVVLYVPAPWPRGVPTNPEVDQKREGTKPGDFAADVRAVEEYVIGILEADLDGRPHPLFGKMSRAAWLRWSYLHADHHLRQFGA